MHTGSLNKKRAIYSCLAGIILFFIITNIVWLAIDTRPPSIDPLYHRMRAQLLSEGFSNIVKYNQIHPPFFYLTTIPFLKIAGIADDSFTYANFLYIIILVLSIFSAAKIFFNEWAGVSAAFLVLLYPFLFWITREYYLDFALTAAVSLVQYLILKSEGGTKRYYNIWLGISVGCTLLIKPHGLVFFLPTWIILFLCHYRKYKFKPFLQTLLIILIIALPWYIFAKRDFLRWNIEIYNKQKLACLANKNLFSAVSFYYYELFYSTISPYLSLAFIIGFVTSIIFDRRWKILLAFLSLIAIPFFALALWPNKNFRFILPILPVFAVLTMGGISKIPWKFFRYICCVSIFSLALAQFIHFSFMDVPFIRRVPFVYGVNARPLGVNWKIKEILQFFSNYTSNKTVYIGIITIKQPYFSDGLFKYYAHYCHRDQLPFQFRDREIVEKYGSLTKARLIKDKLIQCDFVITREPQKGHEYKEPLCKEFNEVEAGRLGFKRIKEFNLPDKSIAIIYQNLQRIKE